MNMGLIYIFVLPAGLKDIVIFDLLSGFISLHTL
jgi:hypothetical protein